MVENKLYIILHGHFYQPPREDPWTGEIDKQPSAYPFNNWNERINKECYAANAASRIIDSYGRVEHIINNYLYLSFNFGPTLIDWLYKYDRYTYDKIIEADKKSLELNNGHGNAIAQVYNHLIMPLASDRDKITQIEWGLKHFEKHFQRKSEGLWLAETAINSQVAQLLIDYGIKYVILAPTQAKETKPVDSDTWEDVSNNNIDPSKPYILEEYNGTINVFFYYGDIAAKISFQHLLKNVEYLRGELIAHNDPEKEVFLVHEATDGEVFGHHEPFGDMCLSRMVYENERNKDFIFTNYGNILDIIPPNDHVRLKEGNEDLGTAWSCAHGVDRWRNDCGCSTGAQDGWDQKWREPLRNAFDLLRDRLCESAEKELSRFMDDIWKARNDYIDVFLAYKSQERNKEIEAFLKKHIKVKLGDYDKTFVLSIMEALINEQLMYTSCGWFFSDISGIETVQDLYYAAKIFDLAEDILPSDTKHKFLNILQRGKSNISEYQNGKWIYQNFVEDHIFNQARVINQYLLSVLLTKEKIALNADELFYFYNLNIMNYKKFEKDGWKIYKFEIKLYNSNIMEEENFVSYVFRRGNDFKNFIKKYVDDSLISYFDKIIEKDNPRSMIKDFMDWFNGYYSLNDVKYEFKERILAKIFERTLSSLHKKLDGLELDIFDYINIISLFKDMEVDLAKKDIISIKDILNNYIVRELSKIEGDGIDNYDFSNLIKIIQKVKRAELEVGYETIIPLIRNDVLSRINEAIIKLNNKELKRLEKVIDFANISGLDFEKYEIQNLLFETLWDIVELQGKPGLLNKKNKETQYILLRIASKFNLSVNKFEKRLKIKI